LNLNRPLDRRLWGLLGDLRGTGSIVLGGERVGQLSFANREEMEWLGGLRERRGNDEWWTGIKSY
jgi:hypothetical protein